MVISWLYFSFDGKLRAIISKYRKNLKLRVDHEAKVSILLLKKRLEQPLTKQCPLVGIQTPRVKAILSHGLGSGVENWGAGCYKKRNAASRIIPKTRWPCFAHTVSIAEGPPWASTGAMHVGCKDEQNKVPALK